jgi:hypothetical protein
MNVDIMEIPDGGDMVVRPSAVAKAGNVLAVQVKELEYAPEFGIDKKYFFSSEFQFQDESFRAYLMNRLMQHGVDVYQVVTTTDLFKQSHAFEVGETIQGTGGIQI